MFGNCTPIPTDPRVDPPPYTCLNCWEPGHTRMTCRRPPQGISCANCGRIEVEMPDCPRCREGYLRHIADPTTRERMRVAAEARQYERSQVNQQRIRGNVPALEESPRRDCDQVRVRPAESREQYHRSENRPWIGSAEQRQPPPQRENQPWVPPVDRPTEPARGNVRDRLGPRVIIEPPTQARNQQQLVLRLNAGDRDPVLEAFALLDRIEAYSYDTRDGMLYSIYRPRDNQPRRR